MLTFVLSRVIRSSFWSKWADDIPRFSVDQAFSAFAVASSWSVCVAAAAAVVAVFAVDTLLFSE